MKGTMRFDSISSPYGCEADAFQVLCGCTFGNGKLRLWDRDYFLISDIEIKLKRAPESLDDALKGDILSVSP
jgi:hypothetical protein